MTSRAVKKVLSQRNRNELEKMAEASDSDEAPTITKKVNAFELLSEDESECNVETKEVAREEPVANNNSNFIAKKNKPKLLNKQPVRKEDVSLEQFEEILNLQAKKPSTEQKSRKVNRIDLLKISKRHLDSEEEITRMFGSKIAKAHKAPRNSKHYKKKGTFATPGEYWPKMERKGLSMMLVDKRGMSSGENQIKYFSFTHSEAYREFERMFYSTILTHNENYLTRIITQFPYHVNSLLQISEICLQNNEIPNALQMIERALYICESSFHPTFNIFSDCSRLPYSYLENRSFFIALHRHAHYIMRKGCWRTALEYSKLILKLDPENDPFFLLLSIDYCSLKAKEYQYLIDFYQNWQDKNLINSLPNFSYSLVLANYALTKTEEEIVSLLFEAVSKCPEVLIQLIDKCGVTLNSSAYKSIIKYNTAYKKILEDCQESSFKLYSEIYVLKSFTVWKETKSVKMLNKLIPKVNDKIDENFKELINQNELVWKADINTEVSLNLCRHIIVSAPELKSSLPQDVKNMQMFAHDPLPPRDSTSLYDDFKILKSANAGGGGSTITQALSSIYNTINGYVNSPNQNDTFRLGALSNLLNNIWPEQEHNDEHSSFNRVRDFFSCSIH